MKNIENLTPIQESMDSRTVTDQGNAIRLFFGPTEAHDPIFQNFAIDQYAHHYWITYWSEVQENPNSQAVKALVSLLKERQAKSVVLLQRPKKGTPELCHTVFGTPQLETIAQEFGCLYRIALDQSRQSGLFLDHAPLRRFLLETKLKGVILNTFAYTASLSVAALKHNSCFVKNIDISSKACTWANENHALNKISDFSYHLIDTLQGLEQMRKKKERFEGIILDPPSFSRSNKGTFQIEKQLPQLIRFSDELLSAKGRLIVSTNCDSIDLHALHKILKSNLDASQFAMEATLTPPASIPQPFTASRHGLVKGYVLRKRF